MEQILQYFKKSFSLDTLRISKFVLSILIIFICFILLYNISRIKGTITTIIFLASFLPLILEIKNISTNSNRSYSKKRLNHNYLKRSSLLNPISLILLIMILIFFFSSACLPAVITSQMKDYSESPNSQVELNDLSTKILLNSTDDYNKTKALYNWTNIRSKNIIGTYSKKPFVQIYPLHIYLTHPYYCIRLVEHNNPEWVVKSRCGACEEFSLFFMLLADQSNLTVRSVHDHGYDHNWDEVLIDDKWVIVDPSMNLFDIPPSYYENNKTWFSTYVFAIYPNGTKEDITSRYTNVTNLTIIAMDEKQNPIPNANVSLFSNNHPKHEELNTSFQKTTNLEGECLINVGGGNYTIITEKWTGDILLSNKTSLNILENESTTYELVLKKDRFSFIHNLGHLEISIINGFFTFIYSLLLWFACVIYLELKKENNN